MEAWQLLAQGKEKWTTVYTSRDKNGVVTSVLSPNAVCWCMLGAIEKCYNNSKQPILSRMYDSIPTSIGIWNDTHTYEEVVAKLKELDI